MIDLSTEQLLSLAEAAKALPGRPHISTLHRWRMRGIRGITLDGSRVEKQLGGGVAIGSLGAAFGAPGQVAIAKTLVFSRAVEQSKHHTVGA